MPPGMRSLRHFGWIVATMGATACVGIIGDDADGQRDSDLPTVDDESAIGPSDVRRLSSHELEATLRALFGDTDVDQATTALAQVPSDSGGDDFSTMAQGVSAVHVDGYYAVASALSDYYANDPTRLSPIASCFASPLDDACVEGFVRDFGRRVFRRPVTEEEQATLMDFYREGSTLSEGDGLRLTLLYMLQAAPFLYRLELDGVEAPGLDDVYVLNPWELATRMAYFAWGSGPDDALLDAAADGRLSTDDGYRAELERLLAAPRARVQVQRFFLEWLGAEALPEAQQPQEFLGNIEGAGLADDMKAELARYVEHQVFVADGSYATLMTSQDSFVTSASLAAVYGLDAVPPADTPVDLGPDRAGLLTRPALLLDNGVTTHPIRRGAHLRAMMLCQTLPPPDPADFPPNAISEPPFDADKTSRERWEAQTAPTQCAVCHAQINPFGFAIDSFDTIGRFREEEAIIDPETGEKVNDLPVDTSVEVDIDGLQTLSGAAALGQALASSDAAQHCFARQWFRYTMGRTDGSDDEAVLREMDDEVAASTMLEMMKRLALTPQFKLRKVK